jgi:hypothetical protein
MPTLASAQILTSADLKDNLQDIQDNIVAPILMRYGRHIFLKFINGNKARAWLREMVRRLCCTISSFAITKHSRIVRGSPLSNLLSNDLIAGSLESARNAKRRSLWSGCKRSHGPRTAFHVRSV